MNTCSLCMCPCMCHDNAIPQLLLTGLRVLLSQTVDSITGNFLDSVTYTKPSGWKTDMTRQNNTIANYKNGSYVPVPFEEKGAPSYGARPQANRSGKCRWFHPVIANLL